MSKLGRPKKDAKKKKKVRTYRANDADTLQIKRMAKLYANGDTSLWVRYAALHFRPGKEICEVVA